MGPLASHVGPRGQGLMVSNTIFKAISCSLITFELLVLDQQISHNLNHVFLVEMNRVIPNFPPKSSFQNLISANGVTGQVISKLFIIGVIRLGATRQTVCYKFCSSITFGSKVMGIRVCYFSLGVILGQVKD